MQTYKYNIKAKTGAVSAEMLDAVKERLEQRLVDTPVGDRLNQTV